MPEIHVRLRWPDGSMQQVDSPSLVVTEHLTAGAAYAVPDLVARMQLALAEASDRVAASYGFPCSRAAASIAAVEQRAATQPAGEAVVEGFDR